MSKSKISIALDKEAVSLLDDYAAALGLSRSRVLNDMILEAAPSLRVVIDSIAALKANPDLAMSEAFENDTAKAISLLLQKIY